MLYYMYMHIHRFQGLLLVDQVIVLILLCPEFLPKYIYIYIYNHCMIPSKHNSLSYKTKPAKRICIHQYL